jgi:hypothetical protein
MRKQAAVMVWPAGLAIVLTAAGVTAGRGVSAEGSVVGAFHLLTAVRNVPHNAVSYFAWQALAGPLVLYWVLTRGWRAAVGAAVAIAIGVGLSQLPSSNLQQYAVPGALAVCGLIAITDLLRRIPHVLPLAVWLGSGLVVLPYVFMAPKYLLPGLPAAALLVVLDAARLHQPRFPLTIALLLAAGWGAGAMVIIGDAALAKSQRAAAERAVRGTLGQGSAVWAGGQWAFLEYAQRAGARPLADTPPLPRPGDYVVVSRLSYYGGFDRSSLAREYLYSTPDRRCGVFVLNRALHAGFFSNRFGYLPFAIGCGEVDRYDVYRILP